MMMKYGQFASFNFTLPLCAKEGSATYPWAYFGGGAVTPIYTQFKSLKEDTFYCPKHYAAWYKIQEISIICK
jgi:hypothetical protein